MKSFDGVMVGKGYNNFGMLLYDMHDYILEMVRIVKHPPSCKE